MTQLQLAWLELFIIGGSGLLLMIAGLLITLIQTKRNNSCTAATEGTVIRHGFAGDGRMYPVVEFMANGTRMQTKKRFNGIKTIRVGSLPVPVKADAWEDEKGYLNVKSGPIVNLRKLSESMWPIGSAMIVHYKPENPKINYVDRPVTSRFTSKMFVIMGGASTALGILIFLIQV